MFGTILTAIATILHLYVFGRALSVPVLRRVAPWWAVLAVGAAMWVVFYLGRTMGREGAGVPAVVLELVGMCWLAALFLTAGALLCVDVVTGFGWLLPRHAPALRGWALAAGGALTAAALFQGLRPPVVRQYEVRLADLPAEADGMVLAALSDLHVGSLIDEGWLAARVEQVQALQPDMVLLLGDTFDGHGASLQEAQAVLGRLQAPLGVWAVPGNHDGQGSRQGVHRIAGATVEVLVNRWVEVRPGLTLAGVEDPTWRRRRGRTGDPIAAALAGRPAGAVILLSHSALETETAAREGVGLMLCGHTHGGQIWPLGYLIQRQYPLLAGEYRVEGMTVLVSRGAGTWGPRMRLWQPGEIMKVRLRRP